jgi:hypothetical protein
MAIVHSVHQFLKKPQRLRIRKLSLAQKIFKQLSSFYMLQH